jgi:hypothetical protein
MFNSRNVCRTILVISQIWAIFSNLNPVSSVSISNASASDLIPFDHAEPEDIAVENGIGAFAISETLKISWIPSVNRQLRQSGKEILVITVQRDWYVEDVQYSILENGSIVVAYEEFSGGFSRAKVAFFYPNRTRKWSSTLSLINLGTLARSKQGVYVTGYRTIGKLLLSTGKIAWLKMDISGESFINKIDKFAVPERQGKNIKFINIQDRSAYAIVDDLSGRIVSTSK